MTEEEVKAVMLEIDDRLNVYGGCKWLSLGPDDCPCAKCQIDRMSPSEIAEAARKRLTGGAQRI